MEARQFSKMASAFSVGMMTLTEGNGFDPALGIGMAIIESNAPAAKLKRGCTFQNCIGTTQITHINDVPGSHIRRLSKQTGEWIVGAGKKTFLSDFAVQGIFIKTVASSVVTSLYDHCAQFAFF